LILFKQIRAPDLRQVKACRQRHRTAPALALVQPDDEAMPIFSTLDRFDDDVRPIKADE
jgi:hypothetical protein